MRGKIEWHIVAQCSKRSVRDWSCAARLNQLRVADSHEIRISDAGVPAMHPVGHNPRHIVAVRDSKDQRLVLRKRESQKYRPYPAMSGQRFVIRRTKSCPVPQLLTVKHSANRAIRNPPKAAVLGDQHDTMRRTPP